ncbi:hypothetical protein HB999_14865 [Listeria booriae]|uniref:hypothetical protein n=1 Tax=Listeria booriae TaxID=1552123 RepID=UPI00164E576A|nr:hypothetical protein [Listeria booriae]MBC6164726.1 hypothetical protein [Listeria booriae]
MNELTWQMIARAILKNNFDFNGISINEMERRLENIEALRRKYQAYDRFKSTETVDKGVD